jgi:hypothetical protein
VGQQHGRVGTVVHKERSRYFGTHTTSKFLVAFFCFFFFFYLSGGVGVQSQGETKIVPNAHAMRLWAEGEAANLMMKSFPDLLDRKSTTKHSCWRPPTTTNQHNLSY